MQIRCNINGTISLIADEGQDLVHIISDNRRLKGVLLRDPRCILEWAEMPE